MQTQTTKKVEPFEVMKEFYELKKQYEEKYYEKHMQSVIKNRTKSKREKRLEFSKLPKPECVSCGRNVGTIFSIKHQEDEPFRIFVAKCGDIKDPCPLDIHFQISDRDTYERSINDTLSDLDQVKKEIIKEKNDVMFGYKHKTALMDKNISFYKEILTPEKLNVLLGPRSDEQNELYNKYKTKLGEGFAEILESYYQLSDNERIENNNLNKNVTQKIIESYIADKIKRSDAQFVSGNEKIMHNFNQLSEKLKEQTEVAGFFIESNMLKNDNPERANLLAKLEDEFGKEMLIPFKKALSDYMSTNNEEIVTKAVEMYKSEMLPKLKDIQQLKYDVNIVEFDPMNGQYLLMQRKNSLESLEFGTASSDIVHSFVKGGLSMEKQDKQKKVKTQKKAGQEGKPKTRKLKPKIIVQEEVEEDQD